MSDSTRRRWGVPAAAATAVLAVVGGTLLANSTGEEPKDRARLSVGQSTAGCDRLTTTNALAGYRRVASLEHEAGEVSFWVAGDRWLVCDDVAMLVPEAAPDVWAPPQRLGPDGFDPRDLAYRFRVVRGVGGEIEAVHLVAGGKLMTEMQSITYTFPDGHEEAARIVEASGERWWFVSYTATDGPLLTSADPTDVGRTAVSLLTPSADTGTTGPMIGGAAQAFVVPPDRTPSLLAGSAD